MCSGAQGADLLPDAVTFADTIGQFGIREQILNGYAGCEKRPPPRQGRAGPEEPQLTHPQRLLTASAAVSRRLRRELHVDQRNQRSSR